MPDSTSPDVPEAALRALLAQQHIRDIIDRQIADRGLPYSVGDLPDALQLQFVAALITDGVVALEPGRRISADEFIALCDSEERDRRAADDVDA